MSTVVPGSETVDLDAVPAAHYALMQEYVDALLYVRNCEAAGKSAVGSNLVRSHVKQRIDELETAYIYRAQLAVPDSALAKWYAATISSLREFRESLPSHSAWRTIKGLASKLWAFAIAAVGLVTVDRIVELPNRFAGAVSAVTDFVSQDFVPALGSGIAAVVIIPLQTYIGGFYEKRRVLLGNAADMQILGETAGKRPAGKNVYKLEDALFRALGLVKRPESQRDRDSLVLLVALILFFWWVPLFFDPSPRAWVALASLALFVVATAIFMNWRVSKREHA